MRVLVVEDERQLAEAVARVALSRLGESNPRPAPLYLRAPDAAPPRAPAPIILPG